VRHVTSAEIHPDLKARAASHLAGAGIRNVTLLEGDSAARPLAEAQYDAAVGGRLFAVLGDAPVMKATLVRQAEPGSFQAIELFETLLKPLVNAPQPPRFRF
jgi:protein-L-isoaspartate(D-aspartate) O-methyltransferase